MRPRNNAVQTGCMAGRMQRGFCHGLLGQPTYCQSLMLSTGREPPARSTAIGERAHAGRIARRHPRHAHRTVTSRALLRRSPVSTMMRELVGGGGSGERVEDACVRVRGGGRDAARPGSGRRRAARGGASALRGLRVDGRKMPRAARRAARCWTASLRRPRRPAASAPSTGSVPPATTPPSSRAVVSG